jgi:hypothetical protein
MGVARREIGMHGERCLHLGEGRNDDSPDALGGVERQNAFASTRRRIMSASRAGRKAEPDSCDCFTAMRRSMISPRSINRPCMASSMRSISRRSSVSDGVFEDDVLAMAVSL